MSIASPDEEVVDAEQKQRWEQTVAVLRKHLDRTEDQIRPHLVGGEKDDFTRDSERLRRDPEAYRRGDLAG